MKASLIIAVSMLFGGLFFFDYLDGATEREWTPVREQLLRLDSGVEHEAKILLRTTIANSAAAVDIYSRGKEARLSEPRVIDARESIVLKPLASCILRVSINGRAERFSYDPTTSGPIRITPGRMNSQRGTTPNEV